jgi:hypothetical protein
MATIELDVENSKHIAILNDEMGKVKDGLTSLKTENAVQHEQINSKIDGYGRDVKDIKGALGRLGWGLVGSVVVLIISMVITNIVK